MSVDEASSNDQNWAVLYAFIQRERLLSRLKQHFDRHELSAAAKLLAILRLVIDQLCIKLMKTMKEGSAADELRGMADTIGTDMNVLLPAETETHFYLIRYNFL